MKSTFLNCYPPIYSRLAKVFLSAPVSGAATATRPPASQMATDFTICALLRPRRAHSATFGCGFTALAFLCLFLAGTQPELRAQDQRASAFGPVVLLELEGQVEVSRAGAPVWVAAHSNQVLLPGDQLRVLGRSRAVIRWSDLTLSRLEESSFIQIPDPAKRRPIINLLRGALYFFHRDKPGVFPIGTPTMSAVIRGTEFNLEVAEDGTSTVSLFDGEVVMTNEFGQLSLSSGEAGIAPPGRAPARTAVIEAQNVIQWCLYYPAVLDRNELALTLEEQQVLNESLESYRQGDLLAALAKYPAGRQPGSNDEKVYLAALLLSVGRVNQAEAWIKSVGAERARDERVIRLSQALNKLIAAVKLQTSPPALNPQSATYLASEWLAESYYCQSQAKLEDALSAARKAASKSTNFAFAVERVAELEFSFGRRDPALQAVEQSLRLAPRNAQAVALRGFLLSAQNRISAAVHSFNEAIGLDGALGNAWLGRGLCRIHQGHVEAGLDDLQVAATLEPQRSLLRSYLGKAYGLTRDHQRAAKEIELAKKLDPYDPTGWLYSALLDQQQNRINEAVRDLEQSQATNDNRRVYRSRLLLDQDRAVRGVNLANIYQDAGLTDVSVWEASRAVNMDYANYSAHLFLANSYQRLRDLRGVNQRFETPAVNEYLLASLLAPVGAGTLAQSVSQQEYSKLFERDGLGLASTTEYLSRGDWRQTVAQYGTVGNQSYALSGYYRSDPGQRPNNDLRQTELSLQLQQQITPSDTVYLRLIYGETKGGDLAAYYDPTVPFVAGGPNLLVRSHETQEPLFVAGYHHEWGPGNHTLVLVNRLQDTFRVSNPQQSTLLLGRDDAGKVIGVRPLTLGQEYRSELEIYSAEAQQIWQQNDHTFIVGTRYQTGDFQTRNQPANASFLPALFPYQPQQISSALERMSGYGYWQWQVVTPLQLSVGLTYDRLTWPLNYRYAPLSDVEESQDQFSPKAGLIWTPAAATSLRAGYTRSLGGVSIDQSFRLEPTQVAGFNQAFRSLIPESVAGANAAARFETWGASLEQKLGRNTYLGLSGEVLQSKADRTLGVYDFVPWSIAPGSTREKLDYKERSLVVSANQLAGQEWTFGARYRLSQAELEDAFPDIPSGLPPGGFSPKQDWESVLHQINVFVLYNHPSGLFGQLESIWNGQSNDGYAPDRPGDDFWQFNAFIGYRFPHRQAELKVGLLNITDQDYRLNPLNLNLELPRERTVFVGLRFYF